MRRSGSTNSLSGSEPDTDEKFVPQKMNDGKLEVRNTQVEALGQRCTAC